jgi:hypothetical protein
MATVDRKKIEEDEESIRKIVDEFNEKLIKAANRRPYLLVLATLYEVDREGDKSKIAGQWNWRSNVNSNEEGRKKEDIEIGKQMMGLLADQVKDALDRPKIGIRERYGVE